MSTKKIKDGASRQLVNSSSKTKATREQSSDRKIAKKEEKTVPKTRTGTRLSSKKTIDDEEKIKRVPTKPPNERSSTKVSRPSPPVKKVTSTSKTSSRTKADRPVTPTSSRVTKSQFFPSKNMYSNALKNDNTLRTKTVTSTSTVKKSSNKMKIDVKESEISSDNSSVSERPRTATLRKASIVTDNIVGPEVPKPKVSTTAIVKTPVETQEYEDDFESYESDFEEYNSSSVTNISSDSTSSDSSESLEQPFKRAGSAGTDDEKKLDSGNYELPEFKHRQILYNIKESIEKENANLDRDHRSALGSLSDEGFEDAKSLQFINFLGAQKKYQHRKSLEMRRKRGEEILSMIRLDHYSFTLLDLAPVPYEVFIKNFGKSNSVQATVQTGEDDLDEEVQTEEISCTNRWTQFPPVFTKIEGNVNNDDEFWNEYRCNYLGVGGDNTEKQQPIFNENGLEKFLLSTGNLILNIHTEENIQISDNSQTKSNIPFSKGCILYDTQAQHILKNRRINDVCFCSDNPNKILTVHGRKQIDGDHSDKSIVCLWNTSDVREPEMLLVSFGEVVCCTFNLDSPSLIIGGLSNGSLVIWDTKESTNDHRNVIDEPSQRLTRTPTYSTEVSDGHQCKIISIQTLTNTETNLFKQHTSTEVCSLDEDGEIIIWSVIFRETARNRVVEIQGLAHWGSVIITKNTKISLQKLYSEIDDFKCTDLTLSPFDSSHLYISSNYGIIMHCLTSGGRTSIKKFLPDAQSQANCLEMCPFSPQYILAGFDNGDINFYSRMIEKPLMILSNKDTNDRQCKIDKIQWSNNRPLMFYTKDLTNTIHVWNLKVSDMFPIYSVPFKDNIISMKLSSTIKSKDRVLPEKSYMMIATDKGMVYVHVLDDDHGSQSLDEFEADKKKFLNYINRYI